MQSFLRGRNFFGKISKDVTNFMFVVSYSNPSKERFCVFFHIRDWVVVVAIANDDVSSGHPDQEIGLVIAFYDKSRKNLVT